jgi:choline dehydrogenase-like flavoprotein
LNAVFRLHFPPYADASHGSAVMSAIYLAKSVLLPEYREILRHGAAAAPASPAADHRRNVLRGMPQLLRFSGQWLRHRVLARRKLPYTLVPNADGSFPVEFNGEQSPRESNRITLADDVDRHNVPRIRIDWRVDDDDIAASVRSFTLLRDVINASPRARLQVDLDRLPGLLRESAPVGGHHFGTARMAGHERAGVVDGNGAVFGLANLYVLGSATFPTCGHANPTLTIVALAVRMAAHLKAALGPRHRLEAAHPASRHAGAGARRPVAVPGTGT